MTDLLPFGSISVVILIRTDTTLDLSQKAEKVCFSLRQRLLQRMARRNEVSRFCKNGEIAQFDVRLFLIET